MIIYNNARTNQEKELAFLNWITNKFPNSKVLKESYILSDSLALSSLNTLSIAKKIQKNQHISIPKKVKCIKELLQLPETIRVVNSITNITVDFTLIDKSEIHFIEFHEKQHIIDSNKRPSNIYTVDGDIIKVPRYLQRLLRDIWRLKYLHNYKIVWYDWFAANKTDIFNTNKNEFALQGHFKISDLL